MNTPGRPARGTTPDATPASAPHRARGGAGDSARVPFAWLGPAHRTARTEAP
jgi:hypothetical protein